MKRTRLAHRPDGQRAVALGTMTLGHPAGATAHRQIEKPPLRSTGSTYSQRYVPRRKCIRSNPLVANGHHRLHVTEQV